MNKRILFLFTSLAIFCALALSAFVCREPVASGNKSDSIFETIGDAEGMAAVTGDGTGVDGSAGSGRIQEAVKETEIDEAAASSDETVDLEDDGGTGESVAETAELENNGGMEGSEEREIVETVRADGTKLTNDSSDFVLLSEAVPDALQEIRYYSDYNFVGERIDGYEEPCALMTKEAASALKAVSDDVMSQGYRLKIYDAYRPQSAVDHFARWGEDLSDIRMKQVFYPDLDKALVFKKGYLAHKSGHSRGSTVDLTLVYRDSEQDVDMGGPFDFFGEVSHPDYAGVTPEQHANRMVLRNAMTAHGFKGISTEWWHFTLKNEPYPDTYFTFPVSSRSVFH